MTFRSKSLYVSRSEVRKDFLNHIKSSENLKYRIHSSERPGHSFNSEFSKGGCLFEGGALSREALIEYIKETSKYFQLVS